MVGAGLPYYEDLELEIPVGYVEDYTLEERLGTAGRQQALQNKEVPQYISTDSGNSGEHSIYYNLLTQHS